MANDQVQAKWNELEQLASQFTTQAQAIESMRQKVRGTYSKLEDRGWIGEGADAFFTEMQMDIFPTQERLQQALERASEVTQKIAQDFKQAEEEGSSLFRQLFGGR